jgi:hypothetical protein
MVILFGTSRGEENIPVALRYTAPFVTRIALQDVNATERRSKAAKKRTLITGYVL